MCVDVTNLGSGAATQGTEQTKNKLSEEELNKELGDRGREEGTKEAGGDKTEAGGSTFDVLNDLYKGYSALALAGGAYYIYDEGRKGKKREKQQAEETKRQTDELIKQTKAARQPKSTPPPNIKTALSIRRKPRKAKRKRGISQLQSPVGGSNPKLTIGV